MKKEFCALALCALAGSAIQAQTVNLYGVLDASVERLNNIGTSGTNLTRMPGLTGSAPSRLGFRGSEDLGGGLKAVFTLEQGFGVDNGALNQGGRAFGRQAYVGVTSEWGALTLGRQYSVMFWSQLDADILGPNMFGSGSLDSYLPNARADNSLAYRGDFGAWSFGATYSFGRDAVNAGPSPAGTNCPGESDTDSSACRQWSVLAKYNTAQWGVAAAIDEIHGGPGAFAGLTSSAMKDRRSTVAGWFKPNGALKLGAGVIARRNDASATTPRSSLLYVGAAYTMSPQFGIDAQVFKQDYSNSNNGATLFAVRGTYNLSKRTAVYATAGHLGNDGTLATSVSNAAAGATPAAGASQAGFGMGVRHSF